MKTKLNNKKGISLIVLVITIIVMIILAAAIILSLSSNGIVDRANEAVEKTDEKQMQVLATTLWADAYMAGKKDQELITIVETGLEKVDKNYKSKYIVNISNTGVELYKKEWEVIYDGSVTTVNGIANMGEGTFIPNARYRITLESSDYSGTFETTPVLVNVYDTQSVCGLFGVNENEVITLESKQDYQEKMNEFGSIPTLVLGIGLNLNDTYAIQLQNTTSEYTIKKIEKLKTRREINEYGYYYDTFYVGEYEGEKFEFYFKDNKLCYMQGNISYWSLTTEAGIKCSQAILNWGDFEIIDSNTLKYAECVILTTKFDYKLKAKRLENGLYEDAVYLQKNISDKNIFVNFVRFSYNEIKYSNTIYSDGSGDAVLIGKKYDIADYVISNNGRTIQYNTGTETQIYEIPLEMYDLE